MFKSQYPTLSDDELAALLKKGDKIAFAEIFNRYWDILLVHAMRMSGDEQGAKDIVQEMFANLWLKHSEINFNTSLAGYFYVTVRNRILNQIRNKKVRQDFTDVLANYLKESENTILNDISVKELNAALQMEIQLLPAKMKQVFEMSRTLDLSHKEIAEQLNISVTTVKKQINNALKIIRPKFSSLTLVLLLDLLK